MVLESNKTTINELYSDLKEKAYKKIEEREQKTRESWEEYRQENLREVQAKQEELNKLGALIKQQDEEKKARELEELKSKKMIELEREFEQKTGHDSPETQKTKEALKTMVNNLKFD